MFQVFNVNIQIGRFIMFFGIGSYSDAKIGVDGICQGIGYTIILVIMSMFRELLGAGTFGGGILNGGLGIRVIPESWYMAEGGFYSNCGIMLFPPMALVIVGCIIWVHRSRNKDLQEK